MRTLLLLILIVLFENANCQVQWFNTFGGATDSGWEDALSVKTYNGTTFISGKIQSDCQIGNTTTTPVGCDDAFLCSIDINGNYNWAKRLGGINLTWVDEYQVFHCYEEYAYIIAIDTISQYLYVEGFFTGTMQIDSFSLTAQGSDIYVAKFDFSGNCIWVRQIGGSDYDFPARSGCFDNDGNLYISGLLKQDGQFDTIPVDAGGFLAKITPDGEIIYAKNIIDNATAKQLKSNNNNELIMMIYPLDFSTSVYINNQLISLPNVEKIIAKLDTAGNLISYKIIKMFDFIGDIDVDTNNNIYMSGQFITSFQLDSVNLTGGPHNGDMFILKLDNNLNAVWGRNTYCGYEWQAADATSICIDKENNIMVGGYFSGTSCYGNFSALTDYGSYELYVTKFNPDGDFVDLYYISNPPDGASRVYDVGTDSNGDVVICGAFIESINVAGNVYNSNNNTMDCFVARLNPLTGVTETKISRTGELLIYANPTTGKCNITIPEEFQNEQNLTLYIYDIQSRLIQQATVEFSSETYRLNLEAEAKGIYNAVLSNGKKSYKGKIVFE